MKILTAYFSHAGENYFDGKIKAISEGNTAIVAKKIAAATGSELFEIARETPYPYSYAECVKEAKEEFIRNSRPELKEKISVKGYDVVILAYPNLRAEISRGRKYFRYAPTKAADWAGAKATSRNCVPKRI